MKKFVLGAIFGSAGSSGSFSFSTFSRDMRRRRPIPRCRWRRLSPARLCSPDSQGGADARRLRDAYRRSSGGRTAYQKNCAMCHGLPNQPRPAIASTMFPPAPELFSQKGMVTDDPAGETYWKVKNGIRLTAMPSFKDMLSDDQIWQVAAVVSRADKLPPEAQDALKPWRRAHTAAAPAATPAKPKLVNARWTRASGLEIDVEAEARDR